MLNPPAFLDGNLNYHPGSSEADLKVGWVHFIIFVTTSMSAKFGWI
jgi:hypothetical protein